MKWIFVLWVVVALALSLTLFALSEALAEDGCHSYKMRDSGTLCCAKSDCHVAIVRMGDSGLEFEWKGEWFLVPRARILDQPSWDSDYHIWATDGEDGPIVRCVVVPGSV